MSERCLPCEQAARAAGKRDGGMFEFIKKHPIVTGAAALAGWYFFFGPGKAAAGGGGAQPQPAPSNSFQDVLVLAPGAIAPDTIPRGGEIVLQLPLGASWAQGTAVSQAASSKLGGTVDPLQPVGAESQSWRNLSGQGTLLANWMDQYGNPQTSTIALVTT
jgi:hypothetical protein